MKTVNEISKITGVSVRTLHHYDQIGLLRPQRVTDAGYRLYGDKQLRQLQQIMFLRELDFTLKEIGAILQSPGYDAGDALARQKTLLTQKRDRLDGLICLLDRLMKGEQTMSFSEFNMQEIEQTKEMYKKEVAERWGDTDAFRQSQAKTASYTNADWKTVTEEMDTIFAAFADAMASGPDSPAAQAAVANWQAHITARYYDCTDEILAGLGEMYVHDERFKSNIDKHKPGLAQFISDAIRAKTNK